MSTTLAFATGFDLTQTQIMQALLLATRGDTASARRVAATAGRRYQLFSGEMAVAVGDAEGALTEIEVNGSLAVRCYRLRFPLVAALRGQPHFDRLAAACPAVQSAR